MRIKVLMMLFAVAVSGIAAQDYALQSPDGELTAEVHVDRGIRAELFLRENPLLKLDEIGFQIRTGPCGEALQGVESVLYDSVDDTIVPLIREKSAQLKNCYNELCIMLKSGEAITFRLYDEGLAYRLSTRCSDSLTIQSEGLTIQFGEEDSIRFQSEEGFSTSFETPYEHTRVGEVDPERLLFLPILAEVKDGPFVMVTESDLIKFPGLWFRREGTSSLRAIHPPFPSGYGEAGPEYDSGKVEETFDFVARVEGERHYPWRIFAVAERESDLVDNNLVYLLAPPPDIGDGSWIEPGVVAFDWWAKMNIYGVGFRAGINTETARYFIDFCAEYGFRYFLFDDGWCPRDQLLNVVQGLDMEAVTAYARQKGVKILLWVHWNGLRNQFGEAFDRFEQWGIAGIKVDFMNRDDQPMVEFLERVAREAASRKMVVDFHGVYKPAGLRRKYPNILTREGLIEFEYNGWTREDTPEHHNLLPYIRMFTGPMDYIPATMRNATVSNFRPIGDYPMGQGTRAHAMALFVILSSPMTMLPDSPSDYYREAECTEFLSRIPVEWDETRLLEGQIGEFTILARRNAQTWYVGAITDEKERTFTLATHFLPPGRYRVEFIEDGINAGSRANDYVKGETILSAGDPLTLSLAPAGGWIARIQPIHAQAP